MKVIHLMKSKRRSYARRNPTTFCGVRPILDGKRRNATRHPADVTCEKCLQAQAASTAASSLSSCIGPM